MKKNEENVEIEVLELSPEDSLIFAEAILNPREPSDVLRRDFDLYKKMVISDQDDIGETNSSSPKKGLWMLKDIVTPNDVVDILNKVLAIDSYAINQLINMRVICNKDLADIPNIQVGKRPEGGYRVGILGILNGVFGKDDTTGFGCICANINKETGLVERFSILNENDFEDIKNNNTIA